MNFTTLPRAWREIRRKQDGPWSSHIKMCVIGQILNKRLRVGGTVLFLEYLQIHKLLQHRDKDLAKREPFE
jgi:hypothetical protein